MYLGIGAFPGIFYQQFFELKVINNKIKWRISLEVLNLYISYSQTVMRKVCELCQKVLAFAFGSCVVPLWALPLVAANEELIGRGLK